MLIEGSVRSYWLNQKTNIYICIIQTVDHSIVKSPLLMVKLPFLWVQNPISDSCWPTPYFHWLTSECLDRQLLCKLHSGCSQHTTYNGEKKCEMRKDQFASIYHPSAYIINLKWVGAALRGGATQVLLVGLVSPHELVISCCIYH